MSMITGKPETTLKRLAVQVDDDDRATIGRAILLRHATRARLGATTLAEDGEALADICGLWTSLEMDRLTGQTEPSQKGPG